MENFKSKLGTLSKSDWIKGLVMAMGAPILLALSEGQIPSNKADLLLLAKVGVAAGGAYILKQLATNSNGELAKKEPVIEQPK